MADKEVNVVITGGLRRIPVFCGETLQKKKELALTNLLEAFVFEPAGLRHDPGVALTKRSDTNHHKEIMRRGRKEFHKK